jgi:hypothetical protein
LPVARDFDSVNLIGAIRAHPFGTGCHRRRAIALVLRFWYGTYDQPSIQEECIDATR